MINICFASSASSDACMHSRIWIFINQSDRRHDDDDGSLRTTDRIVIRHEVRVICDVIEGNEGNDDDG